MDITSPSYYNRGNIQVWDFIRDQDLNYHLGCAVKYICRAGHKDDIKQDLTKAIHYLENELLNVTAQQSSNSVPPGVRYTERLELPYDAEEFDR
jgi:hypothetical protein